MRHHYLSRRSFNRTFMELKYPHHLPAGQEEAGFNRTFMELK